MAEALGEIAKVIAENGGTFGVGALFGGGLSFIFYKMASLERLASQTAESKRMDMIVEQSGDKDRRIVELHRIVSGL